VRVPWNEGVTGPRFPASRALGTGVEIAQPSEVAVSPGLENEHVDLVRCDADGQDDAPVNIRPFDAITFSLGELWD